MSPDYLEMQEQSRRKRESTRSGFLQEDKDTRKSRHSSSLSSPKSKNEKFLSSITNMNEDPEKLSHNTHFQENIAKYSPGIPTALLDK